jgi:integrase
MSDIRKRVGKKGTTYQVRYPDKTSKSGHSYATFNTMKEARAFREDSAAREKRFGAPDTELSVEDGVRRWLDACEKVGRGGRDPVTPYTLKTYGYRAEIIKSYGWQKALHEMTAPDIVAFRSWLLRHYSRDQARKVLSYFHSMVLEMVNQGLLTHDIAAGVRITAASRYDEAVRIPSEADVYALLAAADRLANSRNAQIAKTWERYRPMLYLATDSGMRPQEYLVIARSSFTDKGVKVDRALDAGGREISVTKTVAGRRFIDLSADTPDLIPENWTVLNWGFPR